MFKRLEPILSLCALVMICGAQTGNAQAPEKSDFIGPPPSDELKILAPLVGEWRTKSTVKPSLTFKQGFISEGDVSGQWIHNGHFLRMEGRASGPPGRFEWTEIITYDRQAGHYRRFIFSTDGTAAESVGQWDTDNQTMTWKGVHLPTGFSAVAKTSLEKDRVIFSVVVKNNQGQTTRDAITIMERKR